MAKSIKWLLDLLLPGPLRRWIRRLRSLVRDVWLPVYRVSQAGLAVIQIGHEALDPYVTHTLYGEYLPPEKVGHVLVWNLGRAIRHWETRADLVFYRNARFRPPEAVARRMLLLPYYVQQVVELPPAHQDLFAYFHSHNSASRKSDLNSIRKANFLHEITRDPELLHHFYHELYVPFMQERHGASAEVYPWPRFREIYGSMELLLVRREGRLVAGIVNQQIGNVYRLHVAALVGGDQDLLKTGGMAALYWFSFVEAHRRGCSVVDTGAARSFLKDGVLAYKRKWGARVSPSIYKTNLGLWCLACGRRPSLCRALEDNPFFCEQDGGLIGLIFLGDHTTLDDEEVARRLKQYLLPGERLSFRIVLLTREWAARRPAIEQMVSGFPDAIRILDLSAGSMADLPGRLGD